MKCKKLIYVIVTVFALSIVFAVDVFIQFNQDGLDHGIYGVVNGGKYAWEKEEVSKINYQIINCSNLYFSNVNLIKCSNFFQIRFRMAYIIPFKHKNFLGDTDWLLIDSEGTDYTNAISAYASSIRGLNCINVTVTLDEDVFFNLLGKDLTMTVVCSNVNDLNKEEGYANCEVKMSIP